MKKTYEYLLKNKKYKEIYCRLESRYFGTFSFENLGINKNQKEYYEKYSYMLNNTLGSDVLFEHANGQKLVLKSNARFDIISLLTNFDRIHSQVIIVKDNVSTVHVEHVKTMSGFDRECYRTKGKDKRYFCLQGGTWFSCSKDFEPSYETDLNIVIEEK
jgi:hypothetical protein